jgi:hypothetical protein
MAWLLGYRSNRDEARRIAADICEAAGLVPKRKENSGSDSKQQRKVCGLRTNDATWGSTNVPTFTHVYRPEDA